MADDGKISVSRLLSDLVEYTRLPHELVQERCKYASRELAVKWHLKDKTDFYADNDLYMFDLTYYQMLLEQGKQIDWMVEQIKALKLSRILEFGGGIGEFSIKCAENGLLPHYFELPGMTRSYALWRFGRHCPERVVVEDSDPLNLQWDVVNAMDVLEHLEEPAEAISRLARNSRYIFCNPHQVLYNVFFPQHVSKVHLEPDFTSIKGWLWKSNKSRVSISRTIPDN